MVGSLDVRMNLRSAIFESAASYWSIERFVRLSWAVLLDARLQSDMLSLKQAVEAGRRRLFGQLMFVHHWFPTLFLPAIGKPNRPILLFVHATPQLRAAYEA